MQGYIYSMIGRWENVDVTRCMPAPVVVLRPRNHEVARLQVPAHSAVQRISQTTQKGTCMLHGTATHAGPPQMMSLVFIKAYTRMMTGLQSSQATCTGLLGGALATHAMQMKPGPQ